MSVSNCLLHQGKGGTPKRGRPSRIERDLVAKRSQGPVAEVPAISVRLDGIHHWPAFMPDGEKGRCKSGNCQMITRVFCEKCRVNLCFTAKSNFFKVFHTE